MTYEKSRSSKRLRSMPVFWSGALAVFCIPTSCMELATDSGNFPSFWPYLFARLIVPVFLGVYFLAVLIVAIRCRKNKRLLLFNLCKALVIYAAMYGLLWSTRGYLDHVYQTEIFPIADEVRELRRQEREGYQFTPSRP